MSASNSLPCSTQAQRPTPTSVSQLLHGGGCGLWSGEPMAASAFSCKETHTCHHPAMNSAVQLFWAGQLMDA